MNNFLLEGFRFEQVSCFDSDKVVTPQMITIGAQVLDCILGGARTKQNQPGVCILMERGADYVATIFAAWRAGCYVVPLNSEWPAEKNIEIIKKIKPIAVITDAEIPLSSNFRLISSSEMFLNQIPNGSSGGGGGGLRGLRPSDIAYVIFTSGSTGEPKGVVISVGSYRAYIEWTSRYFSAYSESKRLLLTSELTFDITMGDLAFAIAFGTSIGVAKQNKNIPAILSMIMKYGVDVLYSVPTTHLALVSFARRKRGSNLGGLELIMSGGDKFPWQLVKDYAQIAQNAHFYNVYGPTEVTINCFAVRLDDKLELQQKNEAVPIGECFDNLDYVFLDEHGQSSSEGELCIIGPQIMLGYFNDAERTSAAVALDPRTPFISRPMYRTGDIGYSANGFVYLKGRLDGLVKVRGYRIHPDEISRAIDNHPGVDMSAVVAVGQQTNATLRAYVKLRTGCNVAEAEIIRFLQSKIPMYMIPDQCVFVQNFPLNQSGKIDKRALAGDL